jgi:hypothetical protein
MSGVRWKEAAEWHFSPQEVKIFFYKFIIFVGRARIIEKI